MYPEQQVMLDVIIHKHPKNAEQRKNMEMETAELICEQWKRDDMLYFLQYSPTEQAYIVKQRIKELVSIEWQATFTTSQALFRQASYVARRCRWYLECPTTVF